MAIRAASPTGVLLPISGVWTLEVHTTDDDGYLTAGTPVATVTRPDGTTTAPSFETVETGHYRATYTPTVGGRHIAVVVDAEHGAVDFAAYVTTTTTAAGMPTVDDVADYLREDAASWETTELQDALDAEAAAQMARCRLSAVYPADLRQALLRRVQRNLALRALPLAVLQGDAEAGSTVLPGNDPEVRRLEAPHRRLVVG